MITDFNIFYDKLNYRNDKYLQQNYFLRFLIRFTILVKFIFIKFVVKISLILKLNFILFFLIVFIQLKFRKFLLV